MWGSIFMGLVNLVSTKLAALLMDHCIYCCRTVSTLPPACLPSARPSPVLPCSTQVFKDSGLENAIWGSILMGLVNLVFTILAALLMDRWGRRPLLLLSYSGMATCLFAVSGIYFYTHPAGGWPISTLSGFNAMSASLKSLFACWPPHIHSSCCPSTCWL